MSKFSLFVKNNLQKINIAMFLMFVLILIVPPFLNVYYAPTGELSSIKATYSNILSFSACFYSIEFIHNANVIALSFFTWLCISGLLIIGFLNMFLKKNLEIAYLINLIFSLGFIICLSISLNVELFSLSGTPVGKGIYTPFIGYFLAVFFAICNIILTTTLFIYKKSTALQDTADTNATA